MKKHKPKTKIGVCEYHLCKKKAKVFLCEYCGGYFCKQHIKPKPVLSLRQVSTAKEPLRSKLEEMWRGEKGHPDYSFTPIFWKKLEEEEKIKTERIWESLERLKKEDTKIEKTLKPEEELKEPKEVVESETVSKNQRVENKFPELPLDYLERVDGTSKNPKKIAKLKNIFIWIGVLSFFVIIAWFLSRNFNVKNISEPMNQTTTTVLIKTTTTTVYNIEDICLSQVNENLKIARSKMPSETKVSVINVKKFMGGENITQWVQIYFLSPIWGGLTCESFWAEGFSPCKDYETLKMISETLSPKRVVGVGVAIKKEAVEMGTYYSAVFPVFCDDTGNLMSNSKNFLLTELR